LSLEKISIDGIVSAAAKANPRRPDDYVRDGLLYCGSCKTPKQCRVTICGEERTVSCMCRCHEKTYEAKKAEEAEQQKRMRIAALRTAGLMDPSTRGLCFEQDDGRDAATMDKARRYVANFDRAERENIGLVLWGNTGNGKTFTAACIANALIDQGVSVMMTSFPRILSAAQGLRQDERAGYLDDLNHYRLLMIDDLGAERQSEYALEIVYRVIDARCAAARPMIITTNLTLGELQDPPSMDYKRIYDRVLGVCVPIYYGGESRREEIAAGKVAAAKEIFS